MFRVLGMPLVFLGAVTHARAASTLEPTCSTNGRPFVKVDFTDGPWHEELRDHILRDLEAGLARHQIGTCRSENVLARDAIATIQISARSADAVAVTVEIRDAITKKRVSRDVDLTAVPADGQAFAIALAADELVWATWAEIGLKRQQRHARGVPRELVMGIEQNLQARAREPLRLGLAGALERYGSGQFLLGPELVLQLPLTHRFRCHVGVGLRQAIEVEAPHGHVRAIAGGLSAALQAVLTRNDAFELSWLLGFRTALVRQEGEATPTATASSASATAVYLRSGPNMAFAIAGPTHLELGIAGGLPLRAFEVMDNGQRVTGLYGMELSTQLTLSRDF